MKITKLIKLNKKNNHNWEDCGQSDWDDFVLGYNQCLSELEGIEIMLDEKFIANELYDPWDGGVLSSRESCDKIAKALSSNLPKVLRVKNGK